MVYKSNEPKFFWVILFVITITYGYALDSLFSYVSYGFAFFVFAGMTTSYRLEIQEDQLIYQIHIFGISVAKRVIHASNIKKMTMLELRVRTITLVDLKKGFRIKLQRFSPKGMEETLREFGHQNQIPIEFPSKT